MQLVAGAQIGDVLRMIVLQGMRPVALGLFLGFLGALALGRLLASIVYGVSATDPVTFGSVSILLVIVAIVASIAPAYRATRIEPLKTLREE
jgi:ABC-type antimicrobial peptide transport system permease subunit